MTLTERPATGIDAPADAQRDVRLVRWVATVAGLVGFVLSALTPVLPVVQTTSAVHWPQGSTMSNVTAPLIALTPVSLSATVPCAVIRSMPPSGGSVISTAPVGGKDATLNGLFVTVSSERVDVIVRNVVVASVDRADVVDPRCQRIEISSSTDGTFATFVGLSTLEGTELRTGYADPNLRPQIVGVFTDLTGPAPPGLSFDVIIDTRFTTSPTPVKLAAMLGGIAATIVALLALWRLDRLDGRRMQRLIPTRWRRFTIVDATVIAISVIWYVVGAGSSDDGYQMQMARVADHAGYMSNYFRWFGSPEDPFGWYYNLLALMTRSATSVCGSDCPTWSACWCAGCCCPEKCFPDSVQPWPETRPRCGPPLWS